MTDLFEEIIREIYDDGKEETANHLIRRVKEKDGDVPLIFTNIFIRWRANSNISYENYYMLKV